MNPEVLLRYSVMAMNDTMGPKGLDPSLIVFWNCPVVRSD